MIETLVSASGHSVTAVAVGTAAVEEAIAGDFDVLLLDLMLPGQMDGFEVTERLRAEPTTRSLPILIISAMDDPDSRKRVLGLGATEFYGKPFSPLSLLKGINEVAGKAKSREGG